MNEIGKFNWAFIGAGKLLQVIKVVDIKLCPGIRST